MRKVLKISAFFILTPLTLTLSLLLISINFQKNITLDTNTTKVAYAALPPSSATLKTKIIEEDARIVVVREFFQKYKSPLAPFANEVVESADKYNLDYRLIPAIAMQESNLCKKTPKNSFNCWGFGIYGKKVTRFNNYKDAIEAVTKTLSKHYIAKGLETPEQIQKKYTPSNNGSWSYSVNHFMNVLSNNL